MELHLSGSDEINPLLLAVVVWFHPAPTEATETQGERDMCTDCVLISSTDE